MREGDARDLLQVVEKAEFVPVGQQRGDGFALPLADLQRENAVGPQRGARLGDEASIDVEAVRPGEERGGGFMVAHLGMEAAAVGGGNVRRIRHNKVKGQFARRKRIQQIGLNEADAVRKPVARGVRRGDFERSGGEIDGGDVRAWQVVGQRNSDGSRAGANVENPQRPRGIEFSQNCFDKLLGLGPRNEDGGRKPSASP